MANRSQSTLSLAALAACLLAAPVPAWACCETALSCAAAVASSGATCVIDAAVYALGAVSKTLQKESKVRQEELEAAWNAAERDFATQLGQAGRAADAALASLRASDAEARKITGEDRRRLQAALDKSAQQTSPYGGSAQSAPPTARIGTSTSNRMNASPASAKTDRIGSAAPAASTTETQRLLADGSLESMMRRVEQERRQGEAIAARELATGQEQQAKALQAARAQSDWQFAQEIAGPISSLVTAIAVHLLPANLLGAPQFLTVAIAELATLIERYERKVEPAVQAAVQQINRQIEPILDGVARLQQHARNAENIVKQMEHAERLQSVGERQAAVMALANSSAGIAPRASAHLQSTNALVATSHRVVATLMGARDELRTAQAHRPDTALLRDRSQASFDRTFGGKPPPEVRAARDALIGEARRQYASDPRLLAATEKVIADAARAHGAN